MGGQQRERKACFLINPTTLTAPQAISETGVFPFNPSGFASRRIFKGRERKKRFFSPFCVLPALLVQTQEAPFPQCSQAAVVAGHLPVP